MLFTDRDYAAANFRNRLKPSPPAKSCTDAVRSAGGFSAEAGVLLFLKQKSSQKQNTECRLTPKIQESRNCGSVSGAMTDLSAKKFQDSEKADGWKPVSKRIFGRGWRAFVFEAEKQSKTKHGMPFNAENSRQAVMNTCRAMWMTAEFLQSAKVFSLLTVISSKEKPNARFTQKFQEGLSENDFKTAGERIFGIGWSAFAFEA